MPVDEIAGRYYTAQASTARAVTRQLAVLWGQVGSDFDRGWSRIKEQATATVQVGQIRAATLAGVYLDRILDEDDLPADGPRVSPRRFAGQTASGAPLSEVLASSVVISKQGVAAGLTVNLALERGLRRLTLLGATEVQDAGRGSLHSAMLLDPHITGYVRRVQVPACGRCIVQAGKFFRKNTGFLRHPRCDCIHVPVTNRTERDREADPRDLFGQMSPAEQVKSVGKDAARAIRDGADIGRVVNARSGMRYPGDNFTTARATRDRRRLSPQGVAFFAGDDLRLYEQLLVENGYL